MLLQIFEYEINHLGHKFVYKNVIHWKTFLIIEFENTLRMREQSKQKNKAKHENKSN